MREAQKIQIQDNCSKCPICNQVTYTWGKNIWQCSGSNGNHNFEYELMYLDSDPHLLHFYIKHLSCQTMGHIYEWNFDNQDLTFDKILIKKTDTPLTELKTHFNRLKLFF